MLKSLFLKFLKLLYFGNIMNFDVAEKLINILDKIPNDDIIEFYSGEKYLEFKNFVSLLKIAVFNRDIDQLRSAYNYFSDELYEYTNKRLKEHNMCLDCEYGI